MVCIQGTKQKEDTNGYTVANYHHRNYQAHMSFAVAEEGEHQKFVHFLPPKKPLAIRR
jgi:hypothetical protein